MVRLHAEVDATTLTQLEPEILNDSGYSIGVTTSAVSVSGQFYGLGLINTEQPIQGDVYLSINGSPMPVEVLSIPYFTLKEA